GGLCGAIQMERTDDALIRGYAVAHTDMGHGGEDLKFADDPQLLEDFAHRSTHVATVLLKAVAKAHYGRAPSKSYFRGCSTGGRQGLTAALLYPGDYDAIAAMAPASGPAVPNIAWALKSNSRADGSSILDDTALDVLHAGVLAACDMDDGVKDGIVGDPPSCGFEPASLACTTAPAGACLSAEQVSAAAAIYRGNGFSVGFSRGGELGWKRGLVRRGDKPPGFDGVARNYLRRFTGPDAPKTLAELDFAKHPVKLEAVDQLPSYGANGKALAAFRDAGGKLLLSHAWADDSLTTATAVDVYAAHEKAFGGQAALDPFFRLFVIPGMFHCRGGAGPDAVDLLTAMEQWAEAGHAPERLIAYKPKEMKSYPGEYRFPMTPALVAFSRPVFPFPAAAKYAGQGDPNDAVAWVRK
ncbi:MAG: tannase/feruloyl esterase family alpha/beta hydrolase, partial [Alphaproteobacteria bacterium]|nr:tannase/feruloyl esterase family alpha/beta hydrolase [Alphaproteobacteria bacterium]